MKTKHVILEEIERLNIEGVGDKYAEKKWGIPDEETNFKRDYKAHLAKLNGNSKMGEFVASIKTYDSFQDKKVETPIFLNPQDLKEFDVDTRAVSNIKGDLFVALYDEDFYHSAIANEVNDNSPYYVGKGYDLVNVIQWHRIRETNEFGFSISFVDYAKDENNKENVIKRLKDVKRKNPYFKFTPRYWYDIIKYGRAYENDSYNLSIYFDEDYFNLG